MLVTYRFAGPTEEIYATLVVRLHHTAAFTGVNLWKGAADFNRIHAVGGPPPSRRLSA